MVGEIGISQVREIPPTRVCQVKCVNSLEKFSAGKRSSAVFQMMGICNPKGTVPEGSGGGRL